MKLFEIPMVVTSLVGLSFLAGFDAPTRADFTFGAPVNIQSTFPSLVPAPDEFIDWFSADGLEVYFNSRRSGGQGGSDLWVYKRTSVEDGWGPPENLGPIVNSASTDWGASISVDGLELYFASNRPGGHGDQDIYVTKRATPTSPWGSPTCLGPKVNGSFRDQWPMVSPDGLELYVSSNRPGGLGDSDIYVSKRATTQDPWGDPVNLGPAVNSPGSDIISRLSPDGLLLFFESPRLGGFGPWGDGYVARRVSRSAPWQPAVNLGPIVNATPFNWPVGCPDGSALYILGDPKDDGGNWTYKTPILPILDFNADGRIDAADMTLLVDNWQQNEPLCDIAPFAWGDGVVDEKDLAVLMESLMTPGPKASDVLFDTILSWTGPGSADSYDVYLGTSFDDVNNATRDDPCGVLVSEGQTDTTYDPERLLEFSQTYYWRVDGVEVVLGSLNPVIYRGPVLKFTTEAYAHPIPNVTATASSSSPGMGPEKTVDGSGLDEDDGHSTNLADMWQSTNAEPHWIQFEFDKVYALHELWIWNSNQAIEPIVGFGAKTVKIEYSTDDTAWTALDGVPEFTRAPGKPGYAADTKVSFNGVSAKYVKLTIEANWDGTFPSTGLSEVRFFYIPDRSVIQP